MCNDEMAMWMIHFEMLAREKENETYFLISIERAWSVLVCANFKEILYLKKL